MSSIFPLKLHQRGPAVHDLQRRLVAAGVLVEQDCEQNVFCAVTAQAVHRFQQQRGLVLSDECDTLTWAALVESSWTLGSRLLYLTSPHMRGDDVKALQILLAKLGFDCGRTDGILGPHTVRALTEFQQNYGIVVDGICGVNTIRALERTSSQSGIGPGIVVVREYESLLTSAQKNNRPRILIGCFSDSTRFTRLLVRELRNFGADVVTVENPNPQSHVQTANSFAADIYIGIDTSNIDAMFFSYYETESFVSAGGKLAAQTCAQHVAHVLGHAIEINGMQVPVLRETRMPAVLCMMSTTADERVLLAAISPLAAAIAQWCNNPLH